MMYLLAFFKGLFSREEGQGLPEYGLILALVSIACLITLGLLGTGIDGLLNTVVGAL